MNHMKFESPDMTAQNIDRIAALFPNCITEMLDEEHSTPEKKVYKRAVNFELLKQMLSPDVVDGDEAYEFTWVGKKAAIVEANKPIRKTLRPCVAESKDWDTTENLYIEGDNLEVLKLLQESYLGKVKMIYIDPPYNTGNDFIYADDFMRSQEEENAQMGMYDEDENRLFKNTDTNGRFHSDWCSMIYSRLMLARNLLTEDGVIFISIDDGEVHNMRKICDEVMGESNFVANIAWEKRYTRNNDAKLISTTFDHILLYRKSDALSILREPRSEKNNSAYSNPDNDPRGIWTSVLFTSQRTKEERPNLSYELINPYTKEIVTHPVYAWKYSKDQYLALEKDNRLYWGKNGNLSYPRLKRFLCELDDGVVPVSLWSYKETGTLDEANKEISTLLGKAVFTYSKPTTLIRRMMKISTRSDDIVMDFFSGSATTAHAAMQLNAEDGGHRKCILVTNNENNICEEVTYERNKRVIKGYTTPKGEEVAGLAGNTLRYYRTSFVGRNRSIKNMRQLMNLSTDMLCIKEDLYMEQPKFGEQPTYKNVFRYFDNSKKRMMIIYREEAVQQLVELIQKTDYEGKMLVYVFSPSEDPWEGEFDEVQDRVQLCALPQAIYNAYRRILPKKKDEFIGADETKATGQTNATDGMLNFDNEEEQQ